MAARPEVSVVMSLYNDARHVRASLVSLLGQQGVDFEVVIVDDGSSDGSATIAAEFAESDTRVRVARQENQGLTRALIHGCALTRGDFICRQDADDESLPGRLAALLALMRADPSLSFVSSSAAMIGPCDELLYVHQRRGPAELATRRFLARELGPPGHGSVMFRRERYEQVGGYRPELYYAQDSDLWLRLAMVGRLDYAPEVLYRYRVSPESISGRLHPLKLPFAQAIDELHAARLAGRDERPILERAARLPVRMSDAQRPLRTSADATHYFIGRLLLGRSDGRAFGYLLGAIRRNPLNVRAWWSLPRATLLRLISRATG